jgi:3-methyladenine DNA glycosylase AlkD
MQDFVSRVRNQVKNSIKENGWTTGKVRKFSSELFQNLDETSIDNVFTLCEQLLSERDYSLGLIAYDWAYRVRKQYNEKTFAVFERWLKEYIRDWKDCDDFCTHAFGELLSQNNELFKYIIEWTKDPSFIVRRAAAVVLIYPIKHNKYDKIEPFLISDALLNDNHYLVLKGYGWMLKVLSQVDKDQVYHYLIKKKTNMPRISFRYSLEKFDKESKMCLMSNRE